MPEHTYNLATRLRAIAGDSLHTFQPGRSSHTAEPGRPIFYHLTGPADEVLLCLHGFPASSFDYHKIWDELTKKFAVLSFDLVGYGFSAKPLDFDYTTFNQVDLLQRLLEHLQIKRVHILAHDYGNTLTQEPVSIEYLPVGAIKGLRVPGVEHEDVLASDTEETLFEPGVEAADLFRAEAIAPHVTSRQTARCFLQLRADQVERERAAPGDKVGVERG